MSRLRMKMLSIGIESKSPRHRIARFLSIKWSISILASRKRARRLTPPTTKHRRPVLLEMTISPLKISWLKWRGCKRAGKEKERCSSYIFIVLLRLLQYSVFFYPSVLSSCASIFFLATAVVVIVIVMFTWDSRKNADKSTKHMLAHQIYV